MSHPRTTGLFGIDRATWIGISAIPMWSSTIGLYRGITATFGPVGGSALIFSVSAILALLHAGKDAFRGHVPRYLLLGGSLFICYEIALALAIGYAESTQQALEVGMINYLWPSFTIVLTVAFGLEKADWRIIPGVCVSLFGILWVSSGEEGLSPQAMWANFQSNPLPYGLAFFAAVAWPVYTLMTRSLSGGRNGVPLFLSLTALTIWIKFGLSEEPALHFDLKGVVMVLAFGTLTTLAYSAWNYGVLHGNLALMATASYFAPVLSVLASCVILAMIPGLNFWLGAALVTVGSFVCWLSTRLKAPPHDPKPTSQEA